MAKEQSENMSEEENALRRQAAGMEILVLFQEHYATTLEGHPATTLSAAAYLAGTSLYRSFNFQHTVPPGVVILSDQANQQGPAMMDAFQYSLKQLGVKIAQRDLVLKFEGENKPRKGILAIQEAIQEDYNCIMRKHGLGYAEAAQLGAMVCAQLVNYHCNTAHDLAPGVAAGLVAMGFIEGTKTSPFPLN